MATLIIQCIDWDAPLAGIELADGSERQTYSGTASYHAEYETIVRGYHVACAPNAHSVPDWATRFDPKRLSYQVAALQATVYDRLGKGFVCARCARVTRVLPGGGRRSATVRIIDRMTYSGTDHGGKTRYLDLSPSVFRSLGGTAADGIIDVDIELVSCPASLK
ncbi:RlpA-like double-psi beta-barrel domain-containing protein [Sorangium sp. So ce429]